MPSDAQATAAHAAVLALMLLQAGDRRADAGPDGRGRRRRRPAARDPAAPLSSMRCTCTLWWARRAGWFLRRASSGTHATAPSATVASPEPPTVARGPSAVVSGPPSAVPSGDALSSTALRAASIAARCCGGDFACKRHRERYERSVDRAAEREARNGDGCRHVEPEQLPQRAGREPAEHRADAEQHPVEPSSVPCACRVPVTWSGRATSTGPYNRLKNQVSVSSPSSSGWDRSNASPPRAAAWSTGSTCLDSGSRVRRRARRGTRR